MQAVLEIGVSRHFPDGVLVISHGLSNDRLDVPVSPSKATVYRVDLKYTRSQLLSCVTFSWFTYDPCMKHVCPVTVLHSVGAIPIEALGSLSAPTKVALKPTDADSGKGDLELTVKVVSLALSDLSGYKQSELRENFDEAIRHTQAYTRDVFALLSETRQIRNKAVAKFTDGGFWFGQGSLELPRWAFFTDATHAYEPVERLNELLQCATMRLRHNPEARTTIELMCEMAALPALSCVYNLDHRDDGNKRTDIDQWLSPLSHPSLKHASIDCEDGAELAWHVLRSLQHAPVDQLSAQLLEMRRLLDEQFEIMIVIGTLATDNGGAVYHAYVMGVDRRWLQACLDGSSDEKEWCMPFIIELTNHTTSDWSIQDPIAAQKYNESWDSDGVPTLQPFVHHKVPMNCLRDSNQYPYMLMGIVPHWISAQNNNKGFGEIFFVNPDTRELGVSVQHFPIARRPCIAIPGPRVSGEACIAISELLYHANSIPRLPLPSFRCLINPPAKTSVQVRQIYYVHGPESVADTFIRHSLGWTKKHGLKVQKTQFNEFGTWEVLFFRAAV